MMIVGAATPPGRLAAAIAMAAQAARSGGGDVAVDILNLAETPIEICDGRPLDITPVEALQNKPVGIVAMGGSPHHFLAVDGQLRQVLAWFGALVAPTSVYLIGGDFRDGQLTSEPARNDLAALTRTLIMLLQRLDPSSLGPLPLAAKFT